METYAVNSTAGTSTLQAQAATDRMKSEDFFKLLVTELQHQDPLEPTKTGDMIGQVSQIRSIELSQQLTSTLDQLSRQQRTTGAGDLLGKYVEASTADASGNSMTVAGVVTGVQFTSDGTQVLELDTGQMVRAVDVTRVTAADHAQQTTQAGGQSVGDAAKSGAAAGPKAKPTTRLGQWLEGTFHL